MKRYILTAMSILMILCLTGCNYVGEKAASQSIIYGVVATISLLLLIGYLLFVKKKNVWLTLLFSSVLVVNVGYTLLSVSPNLEAALWANRISYLGSVFLPFAMLMDILDITATKYHKNLKWILGSVSIIVFLIAASPGILTIYYKEVSFEVEDGVSRLVKEYGPLHILYLVYLLAYFTSMVGIIINALVRKNITSASHSTMIVIAVFVNIGVWFIEQISRIDFEMLSISYIISEMFLLSIHYIMNENKRLKEIVSQVENAKSLDNESGNTSTNIIEQTVVMEAIAPERIEIYIKGLERLTPTERNIYDAYIARATTKEVMANFNIKESTLKYHNRNIYGKLGVSTRKELIEIRKYIKSVKSKINDTM